MQPASTATLLLLAAALAAPAPSAAKSGGHGASRSGAHAGASHHGGPRRATGVARDSHGDIKRSSYARSEFKKSHPCPANGKTSGNCPGYVIDHVKPLKRGGADQPGNMQWQTKRAAKQKDRTE